MAEGSGLSAGWVAVLGTLAALVGALGVFGAGFATAYYGFESKDEELRVHLVEIAIGILRADPKEDVAPARGWAIETIENNSGVKFSDEDRKALLHKPIDSITLLNKNSADKLWADNMVCKTLRLYQIKTWMTKES
jgi:hypothetical protein